MKRTLVHLFIISVAISTAADAQIIRIRKRPDILTAEWDQSADQELLVTNPLYEENQNSGENPLYEPESLTFRPPEFLAAASGAVRFELQLDTELPPGVALPRNSYAFDIKLFDLSNNELITQFPDGLTFGFSLPDLTPAQADDMVLGYLDESVDPPRWRVEDRVLDSCGTGDENLLCGKTDHLTTFVIGPSQAIPEPSSVAILLIAILVGATVRRL